MEYFIVIQFPSVLFEDFDLLIEFEDELIRILGEDAVDGHDVGVGEVNFFILTSNPAETFEKIRQGSYPVALTEMKAAFRSTNQEDYNVLWPPNFAGRFQVS